jgi:phosphatidate phosphatase APP1
MFRRFKSDEIPGARLRARFQGVEQEVITDQEGYFSLQIEPRQPLAEQLWHEVELELLEPQSSGHQPVRGVGQILTPPPSAKFGVISDIDDTVVWSNAVNKLKMVLTIFLLNERTRVPFKGVAGFYQALQQGASGSEHNPIFYVSSSPWNLYDLLLEFFKIHDIPIGPLFLRDFGHHLIFSATNHHSHKLSKIEPILQLYPHLPFILIGDSGEQDPEIYRDVVKKYPQRIRAIYIRSVNPDPTRVAAIDTLVEEVSQVGCQLILTPDSEFAATHAAAEGLIASGALAKIRSQKQADENSPTAQEILEEQE